MREAESEVLPSTASAEGEPSLFGCFKQIARPGLQRWRRTKANGDVIVARYADDQIVGFEHEHEAKAFLHDLHERMRAFELALHPDKTRLIRFGRHAAKQRQMRGEGKPETFDFHRYHSLVRLLIRVHAHRSAVAFMSRSGVLAGHG